MEELLTVEDVAALLRMTPSRVRNLVEQKKLNCITVNRKAMRFTHALLDEFIQQRTTHYLRQEK